MEFGNMMKKAFGKVRDLPYAYGAMIALAAIESSEPAFAQNGNTVGSIANTLTGQISNVGKLVVGGSFLGGVGLVGAGLLKLKQAADTQGQQVKYGEGLWRLAVGAGLVAVPTVTGSLTQTAALGGANVTNYTGF